MTFWAWVAIFFGVIAAAETAFVIAFAGIPLMREKRKERKNREQGERGRAEPGR